MAYVNVNIIVPDGRRFTAEVDEDAEMESFVSDLVNDLDLPQIENDKAISYTAILVGAFRIHEGATVRIIKVEPPPSYRHLVEQP